LLSLAGGDGFLLDLFGPTLFFPSWLAAKAVPPPSNRKRHNVEMTLA